jgi:hypothetical protein
VDPQYAFDTVCDSNVQSVRDQYVRENVFIALNGVLDAFAGAGALGGVCQPLSNVTESLCDAQWNLASTAGWAPHTQAQLGDASQCALAAVSGGGAIVALPNPANHATRIYGVLMRDDLSTLTDGTQYIAACTADVEGTRVTGWRYGCYAFAPDVALLQVCLWLPTWLPLWIRCGSLCGLDTGDRAAAAAWRRGGRHAPAHAARDVAHAQHVGPAGFCSLIKRHSNATSLCLPWFPSETPPLLCRG